MDQQQPYLTESHRQLLDKREEQHARLSVMPDNWGTNIEVSKATQPTPADALSVEKRLRELADQALTAPASAWLDKRVAQLLRLNVGRVIDRVDTGFGHGLRELLEPKTQPESVNVLPQDDREALATFGHAVVCADVAAGLREPTPRP